MATKLKVYDSNTFKYDGLTPGEIYEVEDYSIDRYKLKNDLGRTVKLMKSKFREVGADERIRVVPRG